MSFLLENACKIYRVDSTIPNHYLKYDSEILFQKVNTIKKEKDI